MSVASAVQAAPSATTGAANVIAAMMLLIEFGMLRQALARDQIRLYAAQSALLSVLAIVIAADRNLPDLYALAGLSAALKVVAVPLVLRRLLPATVDEEEPAGVAGSHTLSPASAVLAGIVLAAFGPARRAQGAGPAAGQRPVRQPVRPRRGGARRGQCAAVAAARADPRRG
jgi:hydrogenase-4 component E